MKKKAMLLMLVMCILFGLAVPAEAAYAKSPAEPLADILYAENLFKGTGMTERDEPIYQLYGSVTRAQAITMLVRILGKEDEALANKDSYATPFTDVPVWAVPYVGYAYENRLTSGTSATTFSPDLSIPANQFMTFCLRALGYSSEIDFTYADPYAFAQSVGFMTAMEYVEKPAFNRGDMVLLSCDALLCNRKDSKKTLGTTLGIEKDALNSIGSALSSYTGQVVEKPLTTQSVLSLINAQRLEEMRYVPESIKEIALSHEYDDLLSHEECQMLLKQKDRVRTVTKEQAMEDAEYLWKAFASAYGGYYYFGDETFKNAHQQVLSDIRACKGNTISYDQFDQILNRAYSFIKDKHIRFFNDTKYVTYYVKGLFIREDTKGFYYVIDNEKWYLQAVDKGDLSDYIQITIADTGELVYGFYHRFASEKDSAMPKNLTLVSGGKTKNMSLKWTKSGAIGHDQADTVGRFYATENIDGHNVVKIRSFGYFLSDDHKEELEKYMETGNFLSGQDYVIVDSRSHGGGGEGCPAVWMNRFLGNREASWERKFLHVVESSNVLFDVQSRLHEYALKQDFPDEAVISQNRTEYPRTREVFIAKQNKNKHPLFVLTDYLSGSAGEQIISQYRTVENVLIIGTNTAGCMFGNVQIWIHLPNTGYGVGFGNCATLEDFVNREGYGYDPDIWVPSEYALELTLKMCEFYGLQDPDAQPLPNYGELVERVSLSGYTK